MKTYTIIDPGSTLCMGEGDTLKQAVAQASALLKRNKDPERRVWLHHTPATAAYTKRLVVIDGDGLVSGADPEDDEHPMGQSG